MTTFFMEFLRILDISIKTQSKNISLQTAVLHMSFLQNVKFVCCSPQCTNIMPSTKTEYD